jgi:hypothetical protein
MKKVRLAFAAVAAPVLGIAAAPAAAHAVTTTADNPGGTVTALHIKPVIKPDVVCYSQDVKAGFNATGTVRAEIIYGGNSCVAYQQARLDYSQTGYAERIRYRNKANDLLFSSYLRGTIDDGATYWSSRPNRYAYEVCAVLVPNNNHNMFTFGGPICNTTGGG